MSTTNQKKFQDRTPIQQGLIKQFHRKFMQVLSGVHPEAVLEVGAGEGYLLNQIHQTFPNIPLLGIDNFQPALDEGHQLFPHLDLQSGDIYHLKVADKAWDISIASEVLEHLEHPLDALAELKRVTKRYVLLSVPHEPWFRLGNLARGRHVKRLGNHPEHINLWSRKSFVRFVGQRLTVQTVKAAFPWTIVLAKV